MAIKYSELSCLQCTEKFIPKEQRANRPRKFCSHRCAQQWNSEQAAKLRKPCENCGGLLAAGSQRVRRFCSMRCTSEWHQRTGDLRTLTPMTCASCKATFRPLSSTTRFCSMACKNSAHAKLMEGTNNPNYRDGAYLGYYLRRFKKSLSPTLRARYGACFECRVEEGLIGHHIDEDKRNDVPENVAILCQPCHMKFHKSKNEALRASMTSRWKKIIASSQKA